jgi:hypothetical protein
MSPEERQAAEQQYRERRAERGGQWQGMSDSERDAARQQYRQQYQR